MSDPLIHINRKYHIPLSQIISVKQKKHGSVYVYYKDNKNQLKIAVAKQDARTIIHIINQYFVILGKKIIFLDIDKK